MTLSDLTCPQCSCKLLDIQTVSPGETPSFGDLFLCGECSHISIFTPEGMTSLTEENFNSLSPDEKRDFRFAVRNIRAKHKHNKYILAETQAFLKQKL